MKDWVCSPISMSQPSPIRRGRPLTSPRAPVVSMAAYAAELGDFMLHTERNLNA